MLNYKECKEKISCLGIKKSSEYSDKIREMKIHDASFIDVPLTPYIVYKNKGWISWADFLNTNNTKNIYIKKYSFEYLREIAHEQQFTSNKQWKAYAKENWYPVKVNIIYNNSGWISWADFLNHNKRYKIAITTCMCYEDAILYLRNYKFKTRDEYQKHIRDNKILDIPLHPRKIYPDKWVSWNVYLSHDKHSSNSSAIITIENFLMENNILHIREKRFSDFIKYPFDIYIPSANLVIEYDGLQHYKDNKNYFYDLENIQIRDKLKDRYCTENNIKIERIKYDVKNLEEYTSSILTKHGFETQNIRCYYSYNECKEILIKYNIKNMCEWYELFRTGKIDTKIPFRPYSIFKDEWISWEDFFSNEITKNTRYLSFEDAKKYLQNNGINSNKTWKELLKNKPSFIPAHPRKMYKKQYIDMSDWLNM